MKYFVEIIKDQGLYYANVLIGGMDENGIFHEPRFNDKIKEYIPYAALRHEIWSKAGIPLPRYSDLNWNAHQRKYYAYIEGKVGRFPDILPDVGHDYEVDWRESA